MKLVIGGAVTAAALATGASAANIERVDQSVKVIFETGSYAEFSFGIVEPSVSGTVVAGPGVTLNSGNMTEGYSQTAFAYKRDFNDKLSFGLIVDHPFGADVKYPSGSYIFADSTANLETSAVTGVLRYKLNDRFSVLGGLRMQSLQAQAHIPIIGSYDGVGETDWGNGYLLGVAYEIPDIALRVALTYNSSIDHDFSTFETSAAFPGGMTTTTSVTTPESVNLEFQSGVAADTLVFGSVRWVDWSGFDITPAGYAGLTGGESLVAYDRDRLTYNLGVGRKFNEKWSGSVSLSFEDSLGGRSSNLGPTDGKLGLTVGARYTHDNITISGGINYSYIGATFTNAIVNLSNFDSNHAVGAGVKIGYHF